MPKIKSTLGFLFTPDFKKVLLIKKQKPAFHKDKLNGLGGKVEPGETTLECMVREVEEESGLITQGKNWHKVGKLEWEEWDVVMFAGIYQGKTSNLKNPPEEVTWYLAKKIPENVVSNLNWMIPLCIDILKNAKTLKVRATYT